MNNKIKTILSLVILSATCFVGTASAAATSLSVFPTAATKDAGSIFQVSLIANTPGTKICAVEGKLVFDGLACQSITVSNDVLAQTSPTCTNPYFLIGIPSCTISDKSVLSVTVKAGNTAGVATLTLAGVDIIDDYGKSLSSDSTGGIYTIAAAIAGPTPHPVVTPNPTNSPVTNPATPTPSATPAPSATPTQSIEPEFPQQPGASMVGAILSVIGGLWVMFKNLMAANVIFGIMLALLVILLIILIIYLIYLLFKRENKEDNPQDNQQK